MSFAQIISLNIAHWIAGVLLVFAGIVTIRNAGKPPLDRKWPRAPAKAMLGIGLGLVLLELVDPLIHDQLGGETDPMVLYHSIVGVLVAISGAAELYRLRNPESRRALTFVFALCWIGVGVVFLVHEQATDFLLYRHWAFAITVTGVGAAKLLADLGGRVSEKVWGALAIVAGLNFTFYWESADHETPAAHSKH